MPSFPIQLKRSGTASATPSSLVHGEVALNYADGKLFWKDASNVIQSFAFQSYALASHTHAASDITSGTLDAARIANDSITYAKLQNVSATDRLLGRSSAGAGDVEEILCTSFGRALLDDNSHSAQLTTLGAAPLASPTFTGTVTVPGLTSTAAILADDLSTTNSVVYSFDGDPNTGIGRAGADILTLVTNGGERVRVDASGNVLVGTSNADPIGGNVEGVVIGATYAMLSRSGALPLLLNRKSNDGDLAGFWQDGAFEGSISVAGNAVSYNAFCGSHWAQLIDGSRPAILRGTVLETIDEMCEWPGEPKNDRLPRVKVSDTPRSRRVYGVFMAWDEDYAATGDMYATALGAYMVRVSGTVQAGDLLESAGDGTARTQPDDIVRSSTIGKVSSTHRVAEYDDGSWLVPCVLMCG